ncbi:hypothetical protein T439DRAFT_324378 [Meredithblackwellia eburnea MCA 4105]
MTSQGGPLSNLSNLRDSLPPAPTADSGSPTISPSSSPSSSTDKMPAVVYDFSSLESPEEIAVRRYKDSIRAYTEQRFKDFKIQAEARAGSRLTPPPKSRSATPSRGERN